MVNNKQQPGVLILHAAIHALTTYLFLQTWQCWQAPVSVFALHAIIDLIKLRDSREPVATFIADQTAHVVSLILLAWSICQIPLLTTFAGFGYMQITALAGLMATVRGSGFLVAMVTRELISKNNLELDGLKMEGSSSANWNGG